MRPDTTQGIVYVHEVVREPVLCTKLQAAATATIDSANNYAQYDYLHSNLLVFDDIFHCDKDSRIKLEMIIVKEYATTLWKPDFRLILFNDSSLLTNSDVVMNTAFNWTSTFKHDNVLFTDLITSAEYDTIVAGGASNFALVQHSITKNIVVEQKTDCRDLFGIAIYNNAAATKFGNADATFQIGLQVRIV